MPLDLYAFDMLSGRRLVPLPAKSGSWSITLNADDTVDCTVDSTAAVASTLDVWGTTQVGRTGLLAVVDDEPVAAGPVWKRRYRQGGDIELTAGGLRSYWDRRVLLPLASREQSLIDPVTGLPNTAFDVNLTGLSYGTIAKRWIQTVRAWPNGAIPMSFPDDELGPYERNTPAVDLKKVGELIDNLSEVLNGPDITFRPRWSTDGLGIYWEMQHGTVARARLGSVDPSLVQWTAGAPAGGAFDLSVDEDGTSMTAEVFAAAGRSSDSALIARGYDGTLDGAGFPLLQSVDSSHSSVKEQTTLRGYANEGARMGKYAASFWAMSVRAREAGTPRLGDYWTGDMATITIDSAEPILPSGSYVRRVVKISGDTADESYAITFAEALA